MVFCPNGAQGDSPGQRPGFDGPESYQALKGRNLSERQPIRLPYPGRRFALPWAISFCPFGAGKSQPYRVRTVPGFAIAQDWRTPAAEKNLELLPGFSKDLYGSWASYGLAERLAGSRHKEEGTPDITPADSSHSGGYPGSSLGR